jgi:hypothetical protein
VLLPDGSRLVVQVAKITADNVDNSPAASWVDISAAVNRLDWLTGDPSGALSRWIIEQWTVTTADLTALLGDFVDLTPVGTSTAPASGSFCRWGILRADGSWSPMQSGLIETIEEIIGGRVRGWRLRCFGTLLYMAKVVPPDGVTDLGGIGTNLVTAAGNVLITNGFTAGAAVPWPWSSSVVAQIPTLPVNVSVATITGGMLAALHRVCDSMGMRVVNTPTGGVALELWGDTVPSTFRFSDEPGSAVVGHDPVVGTITATATWKRSPDRSGATIDAQTDNAGTPVKSRNHPVPVFESKWGWRSDIPGFPKNDLICQPILPGAVDRLAALVAYACTLLVTDLRLEQIAVDTARDAKAWQLLTGPTPLWTRCTPTFERRRPGTAWLETSVFVQAVTGTVEFATGVGHAVIAYSTRMLP